jgi:hypothetical protein
VVLHAIELIILLLFWPAHSISAPPFLCLAGASHPAPHPLSFGRRIRRRSTDLVLFRFAGAFAADPPIWCCCSAGASHRRAAISSFAGAFAADPPIWCCSIWPAHSPPSRHRLVLSHFGRRIPSPRHHCLSRLAHPIAYLLCLALIAPEQAAYCADSAKANPGYSLLLLIVAF